MKNKIELYDTVRIVKGFFTGAEGVITEIKGDSYTVEVDGCPLNKTKKEIVKI